MEPVQEEGDVSEVFLSLGPPEEALEHRPRVPRERRALGLAQPEVEAREREPEMTRTVNMYGMFDGAISFNQPLNKWNVSNDVTYMEEMFEEATSFNQPLHTPWYAVEQSDSE